MGCGMSKGDKHAQQGDDGNNIDANGNVIGHDEKATPTTPSVGRTSDDLPRRSPSKKLQKRNRPKSAAGEHPPPPVPTVPSPGPGNINEKYDDDEEPRQQVQEISTPILESNGQSELEGDKHFESGAHDNDAYNYIRTVTADQRPITPSQQRIRENSLVPSEAEGRPITPKPNRYSASAIGTAIGSGPGAIEQPHSPDTPATATWASQNPLGQHPPHQRHESLEPQELSAIETTESHHETGTAVPISITRVPSFGPTKFPVTSGGLSYPSQSQPSTAPIEDGPVPGNASVPHTDSDIASSMLIHPALRSSPISSPTSPSRRSIHDATTMPAPAVAQQEQTTFASMGAPAVPQPQTGISPATNGAIATAAVTATGTAAGIGASSMFANSGTSADPTADLVTKERDIVPSTTAESTINPNLNTDTTLIQANTTPSKQNYSSILNGTPATTADTITAVPTATPTPVRNTDTNPSNINQSRPLTPRLSIIKKRSKFGMDWDAPSPSPQTPTTPRAANQINNSNTATVTDTDMNATPLAVTTDGGAGFSTSEDMRGNDEEGRAGAGDDNYDARSLASSMDSVSEYYSVRSFTG